MGIFFAVLLGISARPRMEQPHVGFLNNGIVKLGIDLDLGGAITYISKSGSDVNLVNSADWGRQIQMSHYSGPVPFAPKGKHPAPTWAGLGWNPIQVGDYFGNRSKLVDYKNDGRTIYVKCIPMQWPLNNEPGECTFECWIRLEGQAALVRSRLLNSRSDKTQYEGRGQELPAIYTNGPWYRLMTYSGDKPFSGAKLTQSPAIFPWTGWQATENWAALVDEKDFGLGIFEPGVYSFIGGFAGKPGAGGPKDGPTGYIAPVLSEVIDHNIDYDYRYTLILGSLNEIRQYVYKHALPPKPPVYWFASSRNHWIFHGGVDSGWPIRGELRLRLDHPAELVGPDAFWLAKDGSRLTISAAFESTTPTAKVFWKRFDEPSFSESKSASFSVVSDGRFHKYVIDLGSNPEYRNVISGLRLDCFGGTIRLREISIH